MNRATKFCLIHHFHLTSCQPTTTSLSILTTSCRENASTTRKRQKMLSKSSLNPKTWIFVFQALHPMFQRLKVLSLGAFLELLNFSNHASSASYLEYYYRIWASLVAQTYRTYLLLLIIHHYLLTFLIQALD